MHEWFRKLSSAEPTSQSNNFIEQQLIDVQKLIETLSIEELSQTAEDYFRRLDNWDYHLAKPFAAINETPELLTCFAQVLQGLNLSPEMIVLDFGAGSCWSSRLLSQLGLKVIALDVSASALKIGKELYRRLPVFGNQPSPEFLHFDGHHIDLPDNNVDRINCLDAFHHVPNPEQILQEMNRVLKQGGIAGFSEPGPEHSKTPQAQYEMRMYRVIENDIRIREIWNAALKAGFTDIRLAVFNHTAFLLPLEEFEGYLEGGDANNKYAAETRNYMQHRRVFFLFKGDPAAPDSRQRAGLSAELDVKLTSSQVAERAPLYAQVRVRNNGEAIWLLTTAAKGAVQLGAHLLDDKGNLINRDYFRHVLTLAGDSTIQPGETISFEADVPSPPRGEYILEFDLVSEMVCWFELNGSQTVKLRIKVI